MRRRKDSPMALTSRGEGRGEKREELEIPSEKTQRKRADCHGN